MEFDTATPARFLASAFDDSDLIVIAYRRLASKAASASREVPPRRVVAAATDVMTVAAGGRTQEAPERPIWHHRFVTADIARSSRYLAWLRHLNAEGNDIYVSMNTFAARQGRRTEENVRDIRHIYADFDSGGETALKALRSRQDLPPISYVVRSSTGKFQVIWNVTDFERQYAKHLLCHLAYTLGADLAVHDLNRVLRLPGFFNFKYFPPQFVRLEIGNVLGPHPPSAFPVPPDDTRLVAQRAIRERRQPLPGTTQIVSQSERDWAIVMTVLSAGLSWKTVWRYLLVTRQDKANPRHYASRTVSNALMSLGLPLPPDLLVTLSTSRTNGRA